MSETSRTADLRPAPAFPHNKSEPPGELKTRSILATLCRKSWVMTSSPPCSSFAKDLHKYKIDLKISRLLPYWLKNLSTADDQSTWLNLPSGFAFEPPPLPFPEAPNVTKKWPTFF